MVHLNISQCENEVPRGFSDWVKLRMDTLGIGSQVARLLSHNDLEAALGVYNSAVGDIIYQHGGNPESVVYQ